MIINANEKLTITLAAGSVLTVAAPSGTTGLVTRLSRMPGGGAAQSVTAINGANLTFGAYADVERFDIVCDAGAVTLTTAAYDPASDASDAELTAALAALLATSITSNDATHTPTAKAIYDALALKANLTAPAFVSVGLPEKTPVNATASVLTIPAAIISALDATSTILFDGATFTKVTENPGAGEFTNATELAALFHALENYTAVESTGAVVVTSVALGVAANGKISTTTAYGSVTSGGSEIAKSAANLPDEKINLLAVGDKVTFDGATFTKAAATSVPANEFADKAGLISCLDGMEDWTCVTGEGVLTITAAENGDNNAKAINLVHYHASAGAENATVGITNEICADATNLYHCIATNTVSGANWRRIARGTAY